MKFKKYFLMNSNAALVIPGIVSTFSVFLDDNPFNF